MKINREIVENYLGKRVEIKLFDGTTLVGYLNKPTDSMYRKWYRTINPDSRILFRSSHVRHIKEIEDEC